MNNKNLTQDQLAEIYLSESELAQYNMEKEAMEIMGAGPDEFYM